MGRFTALWLSQLLSLSGSAMTSFALGVWVYEKTHSTTKFAMIVLVLYLPQIMVTLAGGVLADRYSRKRLLQHANGVAILIAAGLGVSVAAGLLSVPLVYLATFLFGAVSSIQSPALQATVPQLVPKRHLGRANGMVQMASASSRLVAPALAAFLLPLLGLTSIVVIDLVTFVYALATATLLIIPQPGQATSKGGVKQAMADLKTGVRFITTRPGLRYLMVYFSLSNIAGGFTIALLTPLVLSFANLRELGTVMSAEGLGILAGSILMIVWGGPQHQVRGMFGAAVVFGLGIIVLGFRPSVPVLICGVLIYAIALPVVNTCSTTIWQREVPAELQGRAIGVLRAVALVAVPASAVLSGVLAGRVFEPLMAQGGALEPLFGGLIGSGPGRGIALLIIIIGLLPIVAAVAVYRLPAMRNLGREIPDEISA
jgi:MFS family permease